MRRDITWRFNMGSILAFAAGAMCGGIVGAVAALFLTPMSGDNVRAQARRRFEEIVEEGKRAADQRRSELEHQLRDMQHREEA
jgi:gas vesicle protein